MCFLGICCDCGSKTVTKLDITNQISTAITNSNKVINDVVNETINTITTNLVNQVSATINIDTGSYNSFTAGDIDVEGGSFDVNQQAKTDAKSIAMMQIASNQQSIDALTSNIISSLQNKVTNNNDLNLAMNTLNSINDISKNAGGPEQMVNSVMSGLQKTIAGGGDSTEQDKNFKNTIGVQDVNNEDFESTMKNIVQTAVSGTITSQTFGNINIDNAASNTTVVRNVTIKDNNGIEAHYNINQDATLDSFTNAILSLQLGSGISNKIVDSTSISALTDALNTSAEQAKNDSTAVVVNKTEQDSAIMSFLNNLNPLNLIKSFGQYGIIILIVIIILGAAFLFFIFILPHIGKKSSGVAHVAPVAPVK